MLYYMDLPLTVLAIAGVYAAFSKYLESESCQYYAAAAAADGAGCISFSGSSAPLSVYVPEGFPCGRPTLHQAAWLLVHPSAAFLLSPDPTHRCWAFVAAVLTPLIWLLSCILVRAASLSAYADNGIRLRSAFFPLLRIAPKAMALAQLLAHGPTHTVIHICTQRHQPVALLHLLTTSIGLLDLPAFLALSLFELLISLTIRYLLSMHGHATWTAAFVATNTFTYLGLPLLFAACMLGWERRCRGQRHARLHGEASYHAGGMDAAGQGGDGLGATAAAAAKVADPTASDPSLSSASSSGEAGGAGHLQQQQQLLRSTIPEWRAGPQQEGTVQGDPGVSAAAAKAQEAGTAASVPSLDSVIAPMNCADGSVDDTAVSHASGGGRGGGGGYRTAALTGPSLLAAAATAVAANNRARGGNGGGAVPFDDPEKWASVILVRQILAQPMAEYQPMFMRQRVSIKVNHMHGLNRASL